VWLTFPRHHPLRVRAVRHQDQLQQIEAVEVFSKRQIIERLFQERDLLFIIIF